MRSRTIALLLALLVLSAGVSAAPGPCCPANGAPEPVFQSVDCCAGMVEGPDLSPRPALTAPAKRGIDPPVMKTFLASHLAATTVPDVPATVAFAPNRVVPRSPLSRLYLPLLI